jgi:hypothetical protein
MPETTDLLNQARPCNPAENEAFAHVEEELRIIARSWIARFRLSNQPPLKQPTELIDDAYLKNIRNPERLGRWRDTKQFLWCAAATMKDLIIDEMRKKIAELRNLQPVSIEAAAHSIADEKATALTAAIEEIERLNSCLEQMPLELLTAAQFAQLF